MYRTLVVGTDGSSTAEKAVEAAAGLARSLGSTLHIVTAFRTPRSGMGAVAGVDLVDSGAGQALAEESARAVGLASIEKFGDGITAEAHGVQGNAEDVILSTAGEVGADLIVVGSKGMRGARRYLGSVPNSVAHGANCAVLVVKTD
jgi:nucleotide-binding universal stress UspA family protein